MAVYSPERAALRDLKKDDFQRGNFVVEQSYTSVLGRHKPETHEQPLVSVSNKGFLPPNYLLNRMGSMCSMELIPYAEIVSTPHAEDLRVSSDILLFWRSCSCTGYFLSDMYMLDL